MSGDLERFFVHPLKPRLIVSTEDGQWIAQLGYLNEGPHFQGIGDTPEEAARTVVALANAKDIQC